MHYLLEYILIREKFETYSRRNCLPPLPVRIALKRLEGNLDPRLIQYYDVLKKQIDKPISIVSQGHCENCSSVLDEWPADEQVFQFCEDCGVILIPSLEELSTTNSWSLPNAAQESLLQVQEFEG